MRVLLIFWLLILFSCSSKKKPDGVKTESTVDTNLMEPPVALTEETEASSSSPAGAGTWQYTKTTDNEGRSVYKASTTSPNRLEFAFPYNGGSTATLTIRKRAEDTHVYIQVSKGQFNRSFQGGQARVRFDGKAPILYSFSAAENGSANIIFFDADQKLINQMKAARNTVVDVEFAGQGKRQIAFRTAGLNWNY